MTADALHFLAVGILFYAINELLSKALYARRINFAPMLASVAQLCITAVAAMLLAPLWGIRGVAAAVSMGVAVAALFNLTVAAKRGLLTLTPRSAVFIGRTVVCSVLLGLLLNLIRLKLAVPLPGWATFLICAVLVLPLYALLLWPMGGLKQLPWKRKDDDHDTGADRID